MVTGHWCHMRNRLHHAPLALVLGTGLLISPALADGATTPVFEKDILPILKRHCGSCHSGAKPKAGLSLMSRAAILRGGSSGAAIRLRAAESSLLWEKLAGDKMPPKGPKLTRKQKGLIRVWINEGAAGAKPDGNPSQQARDIPLSEEEQNYWAFQPPRRTPVPRMAGGSPARNAIDAFVLAQLESRGISLSPPADRATLLRRVSYDLTGLPPTPGDLERFLNNPSDDAFHAVVDRLLASPRYGEHWGRHWLDTAGYADSAGILSEDRPLPFTWRYRDYVIRAFNKNKPYDRFLQEQLAGDELTNYWQVFETAERLPEEVVEGLVATGFLRMAADSSRPDFTTIKNADALYFYPTINDTLQIVASTTMGLTLHCARCHSHKFDPISQVDFYRLQSIFMPALRPDNWVPQMKRRLLNASASQQKHAEKKNAEVDTEVKRLNGEIKALDATFADRLYEKRLGVLPGPIRDDVRTAVATKAADRNPVQQYLAGKFQKHLRPDAKTLATVLPKTFPELTVKRTRLQAEIGNWQRRRVYLEEIRALYDLPGEIRTPLLRRGDPLTPGPVVSPGVPVVLRTGGQLDWTPPAKDARTTGRRLALARWLTRPDNPLTARVMVNRIWMHHFGRGIVSTPDDFGSAGAAPTHPRLLDWLAREFVDSGWDLKHIHRLIVLSATYRQSSISDNDTLVRSRKIDPENLFLWKQTMRRLGAEPFRDAVLAVSGRLDSRPFGGAERLARRPDGEVTVADGQRDNRRSVYLQILRLNPQTLLQAFDQPVMEINCAQRSQSTVATQALTLWNSNWMVKAADTFARQLETENNATALRQAIRLAFSREPTDQEQQVLLKFLVEQTHQHEATLKPDADRSLVARRRALSDLCHMLLSSNEFAYID